MVNRGMHVRSIAALVVLVGLLSACATGRTVIDLPEPTASNTQPRAGGPVVTIVSVTDARIFEDAPGDPSTPSLGLAPASQTDGEVKRRAVARKRHGYGLAQGDVLLASPNTASDVVRTSLAAAFADAGYRVVPSAEASSPSAMKVTVRFTQFWLWLETGVMVGTIRSRISAEVSVGTRSPVLVIAETSQPGQIFSEQAWTNAVFVAVGAFRKEAAAKFAALQPSE